MQAARLQAPCQREVATWGRGDERWGGYGRGGGLGGRLGGRGHRATQSCARGIKGGGEIERGSERKEEKLCSPRVSPRGCTAIIPRMQFKMGNCDLDLT